MTPEKKFPPRRSRQRRRTSTAARPLRIARGCSLVVIGAAVFCLVGVVALYLKLLAGPIHIGSYAERLETSLASRLGPGWRVSAEGTTIELRGYKPAIRTTGLEIRNPVGITVVRAPSAVVSLHPLSLIFGAVSPREIELRDLHLRGEIARDGSLSFSTPVDSPAVPAPTLPEGDGSGTVPPTQVGADAAAPSVVSAAATSLLRPLVEPEGLIGALDRAKLVDAKLSLVGADGRERATFDGVDAVFEKLAKGDRRFEIDLRGPRGAWSAAGRVSAAKGHATSIEAHGVPVADLALLSGLSEFAMPSDVKLSGTLAAAFVRDRLSRVEARLTASPGAILRRDRAPLRLDSASAEIAWDEASRSLDIGAFRLGSQGTELALSGKLGVSDKGDWHLSLGGRDLRVADLDPARPPFRIEAVDLEAGVGDGRLTLDRLSVRAEDLDVRLAGSYAPGVLDEMLTSRLEIRDSDARKVVRLWPDVINPGLRSYLADRVRSGRVEKLTLLTRLDARDFGTLLTAVPMSDKSMDFEFAAKGVALDVVDGLPALRDLSVRGRTTGHTASLKAESGAVEMPDGRRLSFGEASYVHEALDRPGTAAQIGFRIRGGVDALASLMRSPLLVQAGVPDVDPGSVRGTVDLKAKLPLVPGAIPPLSQLGLELAGSLSDVAADKLPGGERLEGGHFAVHQEAGALAVRGEAKLGGSPASFDLRLPRSGAGELTVQSTLDDAARARRSLPTGPALAGPVLVKVAVPLGAKAGPPRVEADLGRATIDGLVPGWQKPAGKPGRLTFVLGDGAGTELRDVLVEAGGVQMKGSVALSATGGVERAEMSSVRLSPGDDMKVQIERVGAGYRLAIRGNNADARGLLKWLNVAPSKSGKEAPDTEIDLNVAILSGFNDEAMTSVAAKASVKGGELRALQFGGKFRTAAVEASLGKRDAGAPILSVRSGDAGATLRFLDFYRRMSGGRLALEARSSEGVQQGQITIDEFGLRGEPALRRIVAQSQQGSVGTDERGAAPVSRQDVDQVLFTRLTTGFRRVGSRMDYSDAVIYGPQVGFNLSGWVDTARDRLDINGTFVPAYLLNNAFSQIPVVGLILGGGRTEGLIAVDFRVAGPLSGPGVTVNPLTAVAPGILRKLFGWMMPEGQAEAAPPVAAEQSSRRRTR
jgi:hypothetical protein